MLELVHHRLNRDVQRPQADSLDALTMTSRDVVREGGVHLLRQLVEQAYVIGRPTAVKLAERQFEVTSNRYERLVCIDKCDDRSNERIVDIRQVRCEVLIDMR